MRTLRLLVFAIAPFLWLTPGAEAATPISIGTTPVGPLTFDTRPTSANGWTTWSIAGAAASITTADGLDAAVAAVFASTITTELGTSTALPPGANAIACWNSAGFYIQTKPSGNNATLLMATLRNDSGGPLPALTIEYDLGALTSADSTIKEEPELYGHRVYWSLNGTTWTVIPELSSIGTPGHLSATLDLGSWDPLMPLYILWADDNGPSSDTAPLKEGAYTIDNVVFTLSAASFLRLVSPSDISTYAYGLPVIAQVNGDSNVTSIRLYLDTDLSDGLPGTLLTTVNSNTLTYTLAQQPIYGPYGIYAVGTHADTSTIATPTNTFYVWANLPPGIAITTPANGTTAVQGTLLRVGVQVSDFDSAVSNVVVYFDSTIVATITNGMPGAAATATVYATNALTTLGQAVIAAVATDVLGATARSSVTITVNANVLPSVTITNPAPNSEYYVGTYVTNISASASDPDGGVARVEFYLDGALLMTDTTSPYEFDLCDVPLGMHTISAVAVDIANGRATNSISITATNPPDVIAIVANGQTWKFLDNGSDQGTAWQAGTFNDSGWSNGVAELGYGDGPGRPERTVVSYGTNANARFATTYFRKSFTMSDPSGLTNLILRILKDDHAIAYLNGTRVYSDMTNYVVTFATYEPPAVSHDGTIYDQTNVSPGLLIAGTNVLAVEVHQDSAASPDLSFDAMLWGKSPAIVLQTPLLTLQPQSLTTNLGANASFTAMANGSMPMKGRWYLNGTNLLDTQQINSSADRLILIRTNVSAADDGFYSVVITNSAGSVTSATARLTVLLPPPNPRITRQPQSLMACIGGKASFLVLADGDPPFHYQWRKDGAIIPDATNTYHTLTNLLVSDAGGYSVLVNNPLGSVTSVVATLVVTNGWHVTTLAGSGVAGCSNSVNKLAAQFNMPNGIAYSPKFGVFVADGSNHRIRLIHDSGVWDWVGSGVPGTQLGDGNTAQFRSPLGLAIDAYDQLFITDTENFRVLRVNATGNRTVALLAGSGLPGLLNGTGVNAYFNYPVDCVVDAAGNVCVAEFNNHVIRRVSPLGEVTVLAGTGAPGYADGPAAEAQFVSPAGITRDPQGNLYVADWDGHRIRKIDTNGVVSTLAGSGVAGFRDGLGANAQFNMPDALCVDYAGNIFVVENGNHCVRRIATDGEVITVAGAGAPGFQDGPGVLARFNAPAGICALPDGSLLISDAANHRIRKLQYMVNLPVILAQPYSARLLIGDTLDLAVQAAGEEPLAYQWYFNGARIGGATSTNLVVSGVSTNHSGGYWVGVSNRFGTTLGMPVGVLVGNAYFAPATAEETAQLRSSGMKLKLALIPGGQLEVQFKNDLAEPVWQALTNFDAGASTLEFLDTQATQQPRRFYRLWRP